MPSEPPREEFPKLIYDDNRRYYRLGKKLGEGNWGAVYEAQDLWHPRGKLVACKVQVFKTDHKEYYGLREAANWQKASEGTKHVARLLDAAYNKAKRTCYIYVELLQGDLHGLPFQVAVQGETLHPLLIYHLASQVAFGLGEIHALGILHRDLKPDNILLTRKLTHQMNSALLDLVRKGRVRSQHERHLRRLCDILFARNDRLAVLTDFGLSRDEECKDLGAYTVAKGGDVGWNAGYSPPEMVSHNHQSMMADIYSFGVSVYYLCVAHHPKKPSDIGRLPKPYDPALQRLVDNCISYDALKRPTPGQIVQELVRLKKREIDYLIANIDGHPLYYTYADDIKETERYLRGFVATAISNDKVSAEKWALEQKKYAKFDVKRQKEDDRRAELSEEHLKKARAGVPASQYSGGQGTSQQTGREQVERGRDQERRLNGTPGGTRNRQKTDGKAPDPAHDLDRTMAHLSITSSNAVAPRGSTYTTAAPARSRAAAAAATTPTTMTTTSHAVTRPVRQDRAPSRAPAAYPTAARPAAGHGASSSYAHHPTTSTAAGYNAAYSTNPAAGHPVPYANPAAAHAAYYDSHGAAYGGSHANAPAARGTHLTEEEIKYYRMR